jgi:hypothetical protein
MNASFGKTNSSGEDWIKYLNDKKILQLFDRIKRVNLRRSDSDQIFL